MMVNRVEILIALRYLRSKRKIRFINIIGYISIVGITIGVAALLIALSVFNGFSGVVTSVLVGFDPHIRIEKRGNISSEEYNKIQLILKNNPDLLAYSPFVSGKAMLTTESFNKVVFIRGVDETGIGNVTGLKNKIVLGNLKFEEKDGTPGIIIGLTLADRLASILGNEIVVYSPNSVQTALTGVNIPEGSKFHVAGIYESNNREYDGSYAYISLLEAQRMFGLVDKYNGVEIRLHDFNKADQVKSVLTNQLSNEYSVSTWYDLHKNLYSVMQIERWAAYILLSIIILVATFNMLGSLTMGVLEKQRDISVLKAMGMNSKNIIRLFMFEGLVIGVLGTLLGIVIGLVVLYLQVHYQIFPLDTSVYIIPAIPVDIQWTDFVSITIASLGLSFFAAYYPARKAAATLPSEGLRWE
ncbi:MAG: ABC transporter permease [Ignavibacteriales bacterium]|nr:ABC transporter permease [Ignavibacteriales bacterium]